MSEGLHEEFNDETLRVSEGEFAPRKELVPIHIETETLFFKLLYQEKVRIHTPGVELDLDDVHSSDDDKLGFFIGLYSGTERDSFNQWWKANEETFDTNSDPLKLAKDACTAFKESPEFASFIEKHKAEGSETV